MELEDLKNVKLKGLVDDIENGQELLDAMKSLGYFAQIDFVHGNASYTVYCSDCKHCKNWCVTYEDDSDEPPKDTWYETIDELLLNHRLLDGTHILDVL